RPLHPRGQHRMALGGVAPDDDDQGGLLDVGDRPGVAAVADGPEQARGRRRLAVARAVVDVVGADHRTRQLLHQVALLVGALRGGDETDRVRTMGGLHVAQALRHQVERLVPAGTPEDVALADERRPEPVAAVDVVPGELALHAGGDAVCGTLAGLDLQDVAVLRPDVEGTADAAVGADGLGAPDAGISHRRLGFPDPPDGPAAGVRVHPLYAADHAVLRR